MSTRRYLITKILQAFLTLAFVLAFNFVLFRGLGNPTNLIAKNSKGMTDAAIADLKSQLGLDLPLPQQFAHYVKETLTGNLGYTFSNDTVASEIGAAVWVTRPT